MELTPRDRAIIALERRPPAPGLVPTFELEFQLTEELLGKRWHEGEEWKKASPEERDRMLHENAELYVEVAERLDYSILMLTYVPDEDGLYRLAQYIRGLAGDRYLLICHGDATYGIPSGQNMMDFVVDLFERADEMKREAERRVDEQLERGKRLREVMDGFALCADYAFNYGPFLSPQMFSEFVTPFLAKLIDGYREMEAYVIKHTDGNIMPILDQIVSCRPHAIHSIDMQAKEMDIKRIKELYGDRICLIGGVQCSLLQTGTEEEIVENCKYVLKHGMPGGGYIYSTSNVAFKGLPLERYLSILKMREQYGWYDEDGNPCPIL